ncbi:hypothetical protein GUJ93_ZPchr0006g41106 [Zizania palustris]|uniref:DUF7054 domain-containing protein n=1 Tax=Zizania palustris TaxID=103762 RepID=A0A8J5W1J9_ZIZPA|nr:hypothetical protein GUJ93_ZPchr0006g41106 [Zizania palustris]
MRRGDSHGKVTPAGSGGRARMLVTVTVLGSAGPLRFLIDEGETISGLIRTALRCYVREGRIPLLGADPADFLVYTANGGSDALKADETISFNGCRNFLIWQKAARSAVANGIPPDQAIEKAAIPCRKRGGGWKSGLNKFLVNFSIKL